MSLPKTDSNTSTIPSIAHLGPNPRREYRRWKQAVLQYLVPHYPESDHTIDLTISVGAASYINALPESIFQEESTRIGRPLPHIQSTRNVQVVIPGETAASQKRRLQFYDDAQARITTCFDLVLLSLTDEFRDDLLETRPRTLAAVMQYITHEFGTPDITVVNDIEAEMSLPLISTGSITTDLATMIRLKKVFLPNAALCGMIFT